MINWQQIETVMLDMDGTLLDLHFDNYFWLHYLPKRVADIHQQDEEQTRQHLVARFEQERGTLNWYCLDYWTEQLQVDIPALKREIQHMIAIRPHVMAFLQQLQQSSKHVMLVTNAHRNSLNIKMDNTGLGDLFDELVVSHDFRHPKEQREFWHQLKISHPFNPATTLLIDDTFSVLQSAQNYGIKHLLTLLQPDSKLSKREHTEFPGILHFDEIMPITDIKL
ncbi:MAG: GMP/IMP nucleotidase [Oceanicoccus sp.]|uniref:GMP/IMP nucleotidase n=1 Tax=Oceanicoccus sp. TaxID=2691044 RepID=UPI002635598D|nr:GMP/IMP nucleotidase [Oceanicoccus sp.]MCP3907574.1 GMP/IMP nucleotidase [Oceanicoccus sp.]